MRKVLANIEKSIGISLFLTLLLCDFSSESHNLPFADESFRRLESGENSEEIVNQCCKREPMFVSIGYGLDDTELRVDVGQCRHTCEKSPIKPLKRDEFDRYLKKYPNMDPVQIFLALQSRVTPTNTNASSNSNSNGASIMSIEQQDDDMSTSSLAMTMSSSSSCLSSTCHPTITRREKHFGLGGQQHEVDVIESCDCIKMPHECQRIAKPLRMHADTPYEKVIDVGQCLGSCEDTYDHSDSQCRSIKNRTVTVDGPNGAKCMQVIDECHCTGNCYRIREFFKVFDYSNVFSSRRSNNETEEMVTRRSNSSTQAIETGNEVGVLPEQTFVQNSEPPLTLQLEPLTKVIDIGRCGGSCSDVTSKCLAWSSSGTNATCISSLYGGQNTCLPKKFVTHSYMDKKGHQHTVISVISCGCH